MFVFQGTKDMEGSQRGIPGFPLVTQFLGPCSHLLDYALQTATSRLHKLPLSESFYSSYKTWPCNCDLCLVIAAVRRRTRDRKVAGSTPGRGAVKSTRSTQPCIHPR